MKLQEQFMPYIWMMMCIPALVLLIACANVANLLIARSATREREMAVRAALGAGRARLIRQLLTEGLLLSLLAGVVALVLAVWVSAFLSTAFEMPAEVPQWIDIRVDHRLLGFTLALSIVTTVFFSVWPALRSSRPDLTPSLKEGSRGAGQTKTGMRRMLVTVQLASCIFLLALSGAFVRYLVDMRNVDPGFPVDDILTVTLDPSYGGYKGEAIRGMFERLEQRLEALPGVRSVAFSIMPPPSFQSASLSLAGAANAELEQPQRVRSATVSADYFTAMGIPLLIGRYFEPGDATITPRVVAIINQSMARKYWPGEDALGKSFQAGEEKRNVEVIGIVGDTRPIGLKADAMIYWPWNAGEQTLASALVVSDIPPGTLADTVRAEVKALDPDRATATVRTLREYWDLLGVSARVSTALMSGFSIIGLLLAGIGLYGLTAFVVARRTREFGIRSALGAQQAQIVKLVLSLGARQAAAGTVLGLASTFAARSVIQAAMGGGMDLDLLTIAAVTALLLAVVWVASYLPARRAARINPTEALRYE